MVSSSRNHSLFITTYNFLYKTIQNTLQPKTFAVDLEKEP